MSTAPAVNVDALKSEVRAAIITPKANACPMILRLAWHASGTYDAKDGTGGSNGATMRFAPECDDDANAGLSIARDLLLPVKQNHPELTFADIWTAAGCFAIEFLGGPVITPVFGRSDAANGGACPAVGRLPDATQGVQHLRDVFHRMGFNDQEIVALSGAHTLGNCHAVRSGFDGPWTHNPLKFDNTYFKLLVSQKWTPRNWDGPLQYENATGELMMLPTDLALLEDPEFKKWVTAYAQDQQLFFDHFASALSKLMTLGTGLDPKGHRGAVTEEEEASAEFRKSAMHGSLVAMKKFEPKANVHAVEQPSGRSALHKAAFWGHVDATKYLTQVLKLDANVQDSDGDTALHDAARFGHSEVVQLLVAAGADPSITNKAGQTASQVAAAYDKPQVVAQLSKL